MANLSGLVMHVDNNLDYIERREIEDELLHESGVTAAHFNEHRPHLMVVEYDPSEVNYMQIMTRVNHSNIHAERIG